MAKKVCTVCGEMATGFNKFAHPVGQTLLCDKCYDKLPTFSMVAFYKTIEELEQDYQQVKKDLEANNFPEDAIKDIETWFQGKRNQLGLQEEKNENNAKMEEFYRDISSGKYAVEIAHFITTSGYNFEGFKITEYHGVVVGETVIGTGFLSDFTSSFADAFGTESARYGQKLETARNASMKKAIIKSIYQGGNALIGVDIDYITFAADKIGVIYSGTSVRIEELKG